MSEREGKKETLSWKLSCTGKLTSEVMGGKGLQCIPICQFKDGFLKLVCVTHGKEPGRKFLVYILSERNERQGTNPSYNTTVLDFVVKI